MIRLRLVAVLLAGLLLGLPAFADPASASVASTPDPTQNVTGTVYAVAQLGDRTIIGGDFTAVGGVARRNVAAIRADGTLDPAFAPEPNGIVQAIAASAGGRLFLGGSFSAVGGGAATNLAQVDPTTGALVTTWTATTNDTVFGLAVSGNRLYAGGRFTSISGQARRRLAAVDLTTNAVVLGFNPWPDWTVKAVAVSPDGTKVYATGGFTNIGGAARPGGAEVLASTGRATAFAPTNGGVGLALALTPDGSRFYFATTNNRMWAYDPAVSNSPVYVTQTGGDTQAIVASSTEVYFGGHFSNINSARQKRNRIASIAMANGALTSWNPGVNGTMGVWALAATPNRLLVGGDFTRVGNQVRHGFARFTGLP